MRIISSSEMAPVLAEALPEIGEDDALHCPVASTNTGIKVAITLSHVKERLDRVTNVHCP
jgi:hypothetical protein